MTQNTEQDRRNARRGFSTVELMMVTTIFVMVAVSLYGTLTNLTHLQGSTDSSLTLQLEGQRALNQITKELRTAGFYRPQSDQTLAEYSASLWGTNVNTDPHTAWDVPYLWQSEGTPAGVFASLSHTPAIHGASPEDEEYGATREISFVPLSPLVASGVVGTPTAGVKWGSTGIGAAAEVVVPVQWQLVSYELRRDNGEDFNRLRRIVRTVTPSTMSIGGVVSSTSVATHVEAARFDTAQTDASLTLNMVKATLWMRKTTPSGQIVRAKVSTRVKLRNSIG